MTDPADPDIAELSRLDLAIPVLVARAEQARQAWASAEQILLATRHHRDEIAWRLRTRAEAAAQSARATSPAGAVTAPPAATPGPMAAMPVTAVGRAPEASTRTFQNLLFILGGLLLCTAAVVFTAVAWSTYGVAGRAAILGIATVLALSAPPVALWRRLRATAETFAGVGLVLVALDGYAAWYVDLFGVNALPGTRYAGLVCAVTAAIAAGYGLLTRLALPGFVAILVAQPAIPLFASEFDLDATGWSLVLSGVVAMNLGIVAGRGSSAVATAKRAIAWILVACWWPLSGLVALTALAMADTAGAAATAGAATLLVAGTSVLAALTGARVPQAVAGGVTVLAVVLAGSRFVSVARPASTLVLTAAVIAAVAVLVHSVRRWIPAMARPGAVIAAALAGGLLSMVLAGFTLIAAADTIDHAVPVWQATLNQGSRYDWQVLAGLALAAVAVGAILPDLTRLGEGLVQGPRRDAAAPDAMPSIDPRTGETPTVPADTNLPTPDRPTPGSTEPGPTTSDGTGPGSGAGADARPAPGRVVPVTAWLNVLVVAGSLAALALPGTVALLWWAPSVVDIAAAALLLGFAVLARSWPRAVIPALAALALAGHAVLASLARPANTAAILGGLVVLGVATAALSRRAPDLPVRRLIGGVALLIGLASLAPAVGSALVAGPLPSWWVARLTCASLLLLLAGLAATGRRWPELRWYAFVAVLLSAMIWPTVAAVHGGDPIGIYAGSALVLIAAAMLPMPAGALAAAAAAAVPAALLFAMDVLPAALAVVIVPYVWFDAIWTGAPAGTGLVPPATGDLGPGGITMAHAVALGLLAVASATVTYALRRRIRAALGGLAVGGPTAILVGLVAAGARWPAVPAVTLLLGLVILVAVAIVHLGRTRAAIGGIQAALYVGAGLAGALSVEWSTLTALGSIVVSGAIVGVAGRTAIWRVGGWLTAVAAAVATAVTAGLAADLTAREIAFAVLGVAVVSLALGTALRPAAAGGPVPHPSAAEDSHRDEPTHDEPRRDGRPADEPRRTTLGWQGTPESTAVQGAAHVAAVVAVLFAAGSIGYTAAVCSLWGVVVGLRALWPGTGRQGRAALAALAAAWQLIAWWLLLAARDVSLVEAYTLPLAGVALLTGWAAMRTRVDLGSWTAYGPALAAAFLPSLALVLGPDSDDSVWRRLLLGAGALVVVFAGAVRRRQAPVVVGGVVVAAVALHEIALVWDLLPRWIPLAVGGLLLVGLAITYERRRRDVAWLRSTLGRMQ